MLRAIGHQRIFPGKIPIAMGQICNKFAREIFHDRKNFVVEKYARD
jgi:hypothetical protein